MRLGLDGIAGVVSVVFLAGCGAREKDSTSSTGSAGAGTQEDESLSTAVRGDGGTVASTTSGDSEAHLDSSESAGATGPTGATAPTSSTVGTGSGVPPFQPGDTGPSDPVIGELCGNGVIDTYTYTCNADATGQTGATGPLLNLVLPPPDEQCGFEEACDGQLDDDVSCQVLGFGGGKLVCSEQCTFDVLACDGCGTDARIETCHDDFAIGQRPEFVTLATNGIELAMGWTEVCRAHVMWFDQGLTSLRNFDFDIAPCEPRWEALTLAPLGDNWVVEVGGQRIVLDGEGTVVTTRAAEGSALFGASRVGSTPLVVREAPFGVAVVASLLDESGAEVWTTEIDDGAIEPHYGSATAVDDGFLVALRNEARGVEIVHLDANGDITTRTNPGSAETEYPQLASAGGEVRLVWTDFSDASVLWSKLDGVGRPVGEPAVLGTTPLQFNRSPIVVTGTNTLVLLGGYTGETGVGDDHRMRLVDDAGGAIGTDVTVQADPDQALWPQLVIFHGSPVAAWVARGLRRSVGIARVNL